MNLAFYIYSDHDPLRSFAAGGYLGRASSGHAAETAGRGADRLSPSPRPAVATAPANVLPAPDCWHIRPPPTTHKKVGKQPDAGAQDLAAAIKGLLAPHTVKRLAALMDVPLGTAHDWVHRRFPAARRRELARLLLEEMDRQDVPRASWRRLLAEWARED